MIWVLVAIMSISLIVMAIVVKDKVREICLKVFCITVTIFLIGGTAETKDDDFANIIKGYMLIALHDYGMECDKDTIDELYQRVNSSTALDVYNKLSE